MICGLVSYEIKFWGSMTWDWFWLFLLLFLNDEKNTLKFNMRNYRKDSDPSASEKEEKYSKKKFQGSVAFGESTLTLQVLE